MKKLSAEEKELHKQLAIWRDKAVKHVQATVNRKKRQKLANQYYECDQSANNEGAFNRPWPEMKKYLQAKSDKRKRDALITANSICNEIKYYKKAWLPTLEEYRVKHPKPKKDYE